MPAAIGYAIAYVALSLGATAALAATLVTAFLVAAPYLLLVGGLAYSANKASSARKQAKDAYNAAQVDRLVNVSSTTAPRDLVLGRVRKGGAVFYRASTGTNSQDLYMAIALAGHEVDAVEAIYLNEVLVTLDGSGNVLTAPYNTSATLSGVAARGGPYLGTPANITPILDSDTGADTLTDTYQYTATSANVKITTYLGAAGQVADPALVAAFPTDWVAAHTVQGCAYLVAKLTYSETSFPTGVPNITVVIRGAKLFDPRTGTTVWSENPALMMRHIYAHSKFGKATVTATEDARVTVAANACDTSTIYTVGGVAQPASALYKAALVLPFGAPARSGLDDLAQAMGGSWAFAGGELYLKAGVYTAPVLALTDVDLAVVQRNGAAQTQSPISISVHKPRANRFNTVKIKIWDKDQGHKQTDLKPLMGAALLTRDGVELVQEVTMPAVGYAPQAQHIAGILMRDDRDSLVVDLPFKLRAYPLELFDTVTLTLANYGWSAKQFMILSRTWTPDGNVQLALKETAAAITQMDAGFAAQGFAANTNLPKPWDVAKVGVLTITSGTAELIKQKDGTVSSRMRITWALIADKAVTKDGRIEVQYRLASSTGAWFSLYAQGDDTQVVTSEVTDGAYYVVRARARTTLAVGDWNTQVQHKVIGKTAAPANVGTISDVKEQFGVRLSWAGVADLDLSDYEIRIGGANWDVATFLERTPGTSTLWKIQIAGSYVVRIKARDTSNNFSAVDTTYTVLIAGPAAPVVSFVLAGPDEVLSWTIPASSFIVDRYEIRHGASWAAGVYLDTTKATGYRRKVDYVGNRTYWVSAIDAAGNVGTAGSVSVNITVPGVVTTLRAEVVDNNALIYWGAPATGSLPVDRYEARKGASWAAGTVIGSNGNSTFTAVFEQLAGTFTYWIMAVDSAGNQGTPVSVAALINQPPDYVLRTSINSTFAGTKASAFAEAGTLLVPANTTQTWTQHFADNAWASPQAQIDAGFPLYISPSTTTAAYTEEVDYGSVLASTNITVTINTTLLSGTVGASCQIRYKLLLADPWTDATAGATAVLVSNFRYVQVVYSFTATAGANLLRINGLNIKLSTKQRNDSGTGTAAVGGTVVTFGYAFISADTPIVQPGGGTPLIPVVIYAGGVNPTSFTVKIFNLAGVDVGGAFSWTVRGY